jgi:hypothetical protein
MVENNLEEKNKMMQSLDKIWMNIGVLRITWIYGKVKIVPKLLKDGMIRNQVLEAREIARVRKRMQDYASNLCQDCSLVGDISHFGEKGMRDEVAN